MQTFSIQAPTATTSLLSRPSNQKILKTVCGCLWLTTIGLGIAAAIKGSSCIPCESRYCGEVDTTPEASPTLCAHITAFLAGGAGLCGMIASGVSGYILAKLQQRVVSTH